MSKTRVLVLGGGYVAIWLAARLRAAVRRAEVELTVVDRHNYHTFHGLVPEMLTGKIQAGQIISPARRLFAPGHFICGDIETIDVATRTVQVVRSLDGRPLTLAYDHLVLNLGSVDDLTRYRGIGEHTMRLKDYFDCIRVRNHLLAMLELAESETDAEERRRLLHFVIAGGNYAGIEVAGNLAECVQDLTRRDYTRIDLNDVRITLVHAGDQILPELGLRFPALSRYAASFLDRKGVRLELGVRLTSATPLEATLSDGRRLDTRTIISCTGTARNPLLDCLPFERDSHGRVKADAYGRASCELGVWAAGDCAAIPMKNGDTAPPLALYAMQGGAMLGDNILRQLQGKPLRPYSFAGMGDCCILGFNKAVGQLWGIPLRGLLAAMIWRTCMIVYLPTWSKRVRTVFDWLTVMVFGRDIISVNSPSSMGMVRELYDEGEAIVRQGDTGRSMYVIESGSVEVVVLKDDVEERLAVLGPGEHFGELAVLSGRTRMATVRTLEPVAVMRIAREETHHLATVFKPFAELVSSRIKGDR